MSATTVPPKVLAQLFGLTQRRIQQLAKDGIIPKAQRGEYPLLPSVQGYVSFLQEVSKKAGNDNEELIRNRIRLESAKADTAELDLSIRLGELLIADHVKDEMTTMITNFRARVLAIPTAIAAEGVGLKRTGLEELVRKKVYEALNELSGYDSQPSKSP